MLSSSGNVHQLLNVQVFLEIFYDKSKFHVTCCNISPLQLNGNRGVNGLSAQPRVAKGQEQGDVIAVTKLSTAPRGVRAILLNLRNANQLLVQVDLKRFFSH